MSTDQQDIIHFIYAEAALIDAQKFTEWLDLYTEDALYWMPLEFDQTEEHLTTSLMYEDKLLLTVRINRLQGHRTYSQKPRSRCHHLLQTPEILEINDDEVKTKTAFHYTETRNDEQFTLVGWVEHTLKRASDGEKPGALKILRKRVNLLNPEAAHSNIQLFV
ncbi:MAG: aromatic-ring-hydroxylating dioxygenase subunit beta [Kordiimonadaceae bacterium]|nr:aromatic-ring-hydroxylating dioxygenase subunit beta [Kordiimonadaceae bacterium]